MKCGGDNFCIAECLTDRDCDAGFSCGDDGACVGVGAGGAG
jgi:hypothetical protein